MYSMHHASPKKQKPGGGFSLPELLVALSLISILGAIATPALLEWLPTMQLRAAGRNLYSQIQNVRMEAIRANQNRAIFFDTDKDLYAVYSSKTPSDGARLRTVSLAQTGQGIQFGCGEIRSNNSATKPPGPLPDDGVSYNNNILVFNSRGLGTAGYVYLQTTNNKKNSVIAVGTQSSGVVRLKRWTGKSWQ